MKYTKIPESTFEKLQLNAGVLLSTFTPSSAAVSESAMLGATQGGVNFTATPTFLDFGSDVDNAPKNVKELKILDEWDINMSGTFVTADTALARKLLGAADVSGNKVTPRNDLSDSDFADIWWVGDYSDENGETNGGFIAIHMLNALSTGGFSIQSGDKAKGTFSFTFTAHYSIDAQDTVPFEVYIQDGSAEPTAQGGEG